MSPQRTEAVVVQKKKMWKRVFVQPPEHRVCRPAPWFSSNWGLIEWLMHKQLQAFEDKLPSPAASEVCAEIKHWCMKLPFCWGVHDNAAAVWSPVHAVVFNFCSCKVTTFLIHFTFVEILCSYIKFQRRFTTHIHGEGRGSSWNTFGGFSLIVHAFFCTTISH